MYFVLCQQIDREKLPHCIYAYGHFIRHAILAAISIMAGLCGVFVVGYCFVEFQLIRKYLSYYFP
jgi:hypothetical protein